MADLIWNQEQMTTGVPAVDAQHQEWIRRYNEFNRAIQEGKGMDAVKNTLDFFIDYADTHFKFEEKVMAERNCSAAKANKDAHKSMLKTLKGFKSYGRKNKFSMIEMVGLRIQMEKWLVDHILGIDIKLRETVR